MEAASGRGAGHQQLEDCVGPSHRSCDAVEEVACARSEHAPASQRRPCPAGPGHRAAVLRVARRTARAGLAVCVSLLVSSGRVVSGGLPASSKPLSDSFLARASIQDPTSLIGGRVRLNLSGEDRPGGETVRLGFADSMMHRGECAAELAFVGGMTLPEIGFKGGPSSSVSVRPEKAAGQWRPAQTTARTPRLNVTASVIVVPGMLQVHPLSLSVISKRRGSESSKARLLQELAGERPQDDLLRPFRGKSPRGDSSQGRFQRSVPGTGRAGLSPSSGGLVAKLSMPPLVSSGGEPLTLGHVRDDRGDLVGKLRGLSGRFEMAHKIELAETKDGPSEVEQYINSARARDRAQQAAVWHAPHATHAEPLLPPSDSWLEDAKIRDAELVPAVASLLSSAAAAGDCGRGGAPEEERGAEGEEEAGGKGTRERGSVFQALREPKVSVEEYASRIARYGSCAPGCLALSLVYLDRFLARHSELEVSVLNAHRLLLGCTLVAAKQWEDSVYRNAFWAKVGGVSCAEINLLERQLLRGIDFRLHVDKPEFDQYRAALVEWTAGSAREPGSAARGLAHKSSLFATVLEMDPLLTVFPTSPAPDTSSEADALRCETEEVARHETEEVVRREREEVVLAPGSTLSARRQALAVAV